MLEYRHDNRGPIFEIANRVLDSTGTKIMADIDNELSGYILNSISGQIINSISGYILNSVSAQITNTISAEVLTTLSAEITGTLPVSAADSAIYFQLWEDQRFAYSAGNLKYKGLHITHGADIQDDNWYIWKYKWSAAGNCTRIEGPLIGAWYHRATLAWD